MAASTVLNSLALALVGVSATRFYIYGTTDAVAEGANRAFARFFFLTFFLTSVVFLPASFFFTTILFFVPDFFFADDFFFATTLVLRVLGASSAGAGLIAGTTFF